VFSPYYAWARRRGPAAAADFSALNVALYRPGGNRWAMTERPGRALSRTAETFTVGPSAVHFDGRCLTVMIDERGAPLPARIRGEVRLEAAALTDRTFHLDAAGRHCWRPLAPSARVTVAMQDPAWRWQGSGYFDSNSGTEPLADGFRHWTWCRAPLADGGTAVFYDVARRDGSALSLGLRLDGTGGVREIAVPPFVPLPRSLWRIDRAVRASPQAGAGPAPRVVRTLEDAPFYARSLVATAIDGNPVLAMHESLSLDRFRRPWVQMLLPFRMPRMWR
jgi:carotenoid 1,2-hydratase